MPTPPRRRGPSRLASASSKLTVRQKAAPAPDDGDDLEEEFTRRRASRKKSGLRAWLGRIRLPTFRAPENLFRLGLKIAFLAFIWGGMALGCVLLYYGYDMPDIRQVAQPVRRPAITLNADDGTVFARMGDLYGKHVTLQDVPPNLVHAILAIEDRRFFSHWGIDPWGIARAAVRNVLAGHLVQGGSTLTQQLAKNLFLTPDRTLRRKIQEVLLALWLERTYTKEQILTAYLNRVYLGSGAYGVDGAAEIYFGKPVSDIDLRESATIAGLLRAPSRFAPNSNATQAAQRTDTVLNAMVDAGYITEEEKMAAGAETPMPRRKPGAGGDGRYFADWVVDQLSGMMANQPQDLVVDTTLDLRLERIGERQLDATLASEKERGVSQGALVTLAPDGGVRAMVGGRDYDTSQFNRATQAFRQPGSSFKPIIYLAAIRGGLKPDDLLEDAPLTIGDWSPENYERKYLGQVTARTALAESINTVAVRVLQQIGLSKAIETARALGISSTIQPNLSLALGTNSVTPLEMTGAYATLAAGGRAIAPYGIKEVRNREGKVLYHRPEVNMPLAVEPEAVASLVDMMTEVVRSGTGKRAALDRPVAGKTGTTSDYRDAWFIGMTGNMTTGVWLGNDNNEPMKRVTGGTLPAGLWHNYMAEAEAPLPVRALLEGTAAGASVSSGEPAAQTTEGEQAAGGSLPESQGQVLGGQAVQLAPAPAQAPASSGGGDKLGDFIRTLTGGASAPQPAKALAPPQAASRTAPQPEGTPSTMGVLGTLKVGEH